MQVLRLLIILFFNDVQYTHAIHTDQVTFSYLQDGLKF